MAIDLTDDVVRSFLADAGEALERLNEQLVELEVRADDAGLLDAVFRGFHTIKAGAGFIGLAPVVEICHAAEDIGNALRRGSCPVDAGVTDTLLRVLDTLSAMRARIAAGEDCAPAEPGLLAALAALAGGRPRTATHDGGPPLRWAHLAAGPRAGDEISDQEIEEPLDSLNGGGARAGAPAPGRVPAAGGRESGAAFYGAVDDQITDEEFEALLDELHGAGQAPNAHACRYATAAPPRGPAAERTVRVNTDVLDRIMDMVGELVQVRDRVVTLEGALADEEMAKAARRLDAVTSGLQAAVTRTRMQPARMIFGRFPRVVRDLARNLGKEVELVVEGENTELDRCLVDALADPMVHLVRNAVDHGIEVPDVRVAGGKPRAGKIVLSAEQQSDRIMLAIADDGAGIDPEVLRRKAVEKGLLDRQTAACLDRGDCFNLIFIAGFSTKSRISDVSGRGVGMDVVKNGVARLNGSVRVESTVGRGTTMRIEVPLTLVIDVAGLVSAYPRR